MKTRSTRAARGTLHARRASHSKATTSRPTGSNIDIRTILVPTDFSPPSLKALKYARALAKEFGAALHLLHVNDIAVEAPTLAPLFPANREMGNKLRRRLHAIAAECALPIRGLRCHVRVGKAFNEVCDAARELRADLIITATHGYTGVTRVLLGSTAERIVQHSPCPVLVVREREREFIRNGVFQLKKILVPTDFSEHSLQALRYAIGLAKRFGAKLVMLHSVYPHYYSTNDEYTASDLPALMQSVSDAAETQMRELVRKTAFLGVPFETDIFLGFPGQKIVDYATAKAVDLIITSTHGRTGLKHVLIGSTAEQVVRYSKCPVLVVPRTQAASAPSSA